MEQDLIFLGFFLKKIELKDQVSECVESFKEQGVNLILTSSQCVYSTLGVATRSQIIDSEKPVLIGRTAVQNQVEVLVWEKMDNKKEDFESSVLEAAEDLDVSEEDFFEKTDCQIALTGRAFNLASQSLSKRQLKSLLQKVKVIGNIKKGES